MSTAAQILAFWLVLSICVVPAALLLLQSLSAARCRFRLRPTPSVARSPVVMLVPAHNEAAGIAATLASLLSQAEMGDRIVVVADNCTDATAAVASAAGAEVIERHDLSRRGKGHALQFGFDHLRTAMPEVVLMFDADCIAGPHCVAWLASEAERLRRPVQSCYVLHAADDGVRARLGEFAFRLRNWVRPLGMAHWNLPTQLTGSGMAFHRSLLERVALASGHLTEDLQLGLAFGRLGLHPVFCVEARVDSFLAGDREAAVTQRTRWEHGHLAMMVSTVPRLVVDAIRRRDVRSFFMALDVAVPPLALLLTLIIGVGALCVIGAVAGASWWLPVAACFAFSMVTVTIVVTQRCFASDLITLQEIFLAAPLYLLRKLPLYAGFLINRQVEWVRTKRDAR